MKKITLLVTLLFLSLQSQAQLFSQNFDTALTWTVTHPTGADTNAGWTRVTTGSNPSCLPAAGAGMAKFASYDVAATNVYNLTSPAFTLTAGANYRVKFKMYRDGTYPTDADNIKLYFKSSPLTATGTLLGTVNRSIALAPTVSAEGWYTYYFDFPAGTTGTKYLFFQATSFFGNNIFIDEVGVYTGVTNDAEIVSANLPIYTSPGSNVISGSFVNNGTNAITSIDLNWQIPGTTLQTQTLTGLNIAPGANYAFNHSIPWVVTPGTYAVTVSVSNTNGGDSDPTNNQITKTVSVANNSAPRFPLYEKFSSSTCGPCATFNINYFTPFYTVSGQNLALIDYQVNWPGAGDPYYTAEVGTRRAYYAVTAAPTLFVDAKEGTNFDQALLQNNFNTAIASPAYFSVSATESVVGNDITVEVKTTPYLSGTFRLYAIVVEKVTTGNVGTNGETQWKNVLMKMLPDANGTVLNCTTDTIISTTLQANLSGLNIEEMSDLEVIVFVQDYENKIVMQSTIAVNALATTEFNASPKIKLVPNPSEGLVRINTEAAVNVTISDLTGKVVFEMPAVTKETTMNLSTLQKGVYFVKMEGAGTSQTQKLLLK
jgi:hypothetical protein